MVVEKFEIFENEREREREREILRKKKANVRRRKEESIFLTLVGGDVGVRCTLHLSLIHSRKNLII